MNNILQHGDSIASEFASQTGMSSSMVSSRKKMFQESDQNDLQDFKQQIQQKFLRSVANKMYTYPLNEEGFDLIDDEQEFAELTNVTQYNLFQQDVPDGQKFKKQQFKIKNSKLSCKTATLLLETLRSERQRISSLRSYINDAIQSKREGRVGGEAQEFTNRAINQEYPSHNYRKKRLNTEPYEKPMGFILKKK